MVRRRQRASKTAPIEQTIVNGKALNLVLEEQYFASPKRKECKIVDTSNSFSNNQNNHHEKRTAISPKTAAKSKYERIIGVPLATRSQTRIENFFKNNAKLKTNATPIIQAETPYYDLCNDDDDDDEIDDRGLNLNINIVHDEGDDTTNDTDATEYSDEPHVSFEFLACQNHSNSNYNPTTANGATCENIFLQEPVLKLEVDETLIHTPISKGLELEPIFSSPSSLNGHFNKIVSLNGQLTNGPMLPDNDNSSCDSGVAFSAHSVGNFSPTHSSSLTASGSTATNRRRKPNTPHRIVCPSPVKSMPVLVANHSNSKLIANGHVTPRKSQRNYALMPVPAATYSNKPSSRQRLNHQYQLQPQQQQQNHQLKSQETANGINKTAVHKIKKNEENKLKVETYCEEYVDVEAHELEMEKIKKEDIKPQLSVKLSTTNGLVATIDNKTSVKSEKKPNKMKQLTGNSNNGRMSELSEFFPVRRSVRKTKTAVKEEMMHQLEQAILEEREDGLRIEYFNGKGRGVVTERRFQRGEFVVEYVGDLISMSEAAERDKRYALDENAGCYMYYFKHKNQQYCIDATADTGKLGRLVNHSRNGNLMTKVVVVKQRPHLILVAKDDIEAGDELCYDYGDRSKESLLHHPWLAF